MTTLEEDDDDDDDVMGHPGFAHSVAHLMSGSSATSAKIRCLHV